MSAPKPTEPRAPAERVIIDRVANGFFLQVGCHGEVTFFIAKDAEEAADFVAAFDWRVAMVPAPTSRLPDPGVGQESASSTADNGRLGVVPEPAKRDAKK